jgi:8-hydroxy-5-deazaflavin:NADPH oxidoreductase
VTTVTIFGSGNMGTAIAGVLQDGGARVEHIGRDAQDASIEGDIVVLAVPYPAVRDIVSEYGKRLAGKIVVDISNPVDQQTYDSLVVAPDSSAAAEVAAALPSSQVLKAFNTNFAGTLAAKKNGAQPTTVLIAGDDDAAKQTLADAVTAGGLEAIDAGPLRRARELEAVGFLQIKLAVAEKVGWTAGFAIVQ